MIILISGSKTEKSGTPKDLSSIGILSSAEENAKVKNPNTVARKGTRLIMSNTLPGTGTKELLPENALDWFLKNGKRVAPFRGLHNSSRRTDLLRSKLVSGSNNFRQITSKSKWLVKPELTTGIRIDTAFSIENRGDWHVPVEGVFVDENDQLWEGVLHSDYLLQLDNGKGNHIYITDPSQPVPDRRVEPANEKLKTFSSDAERVDLYSSNTNDEGMARLAEFSKLKHLSLGVTPVTDDGLVYLKDLDELKWLRLDYTEITDEGLKHLHGMKNLFRVSLSGTKTTKAGVKELFDSLDKCKKIVGPEMYILER